RRDQEQRAANHRSAPRHQTRCQRPQGRRGCARRGDPACAGEHFAAPRRRRARLDWAPEVQCYARLRVAIVSTGDEVVRPGARLGEGKVYDANAPMLEALVAGAGALSTDLGILPDDLGEVTRRLASAAAGFDVIISSGGASRGEEDHIVAALDRLGKRRMCELAIKPGRRCSFGQIGNCVVVGLPGNPVAVFVCFLLYVYPLLRRMGGADWPEPRRYRLPALFDFPNRKTGRREFWR